MRDNFLTGLSLQGRHGDTELAHLTEGEVVLPQQVAAKLQMQIQNIMDKPNLDELTVGKGKVNPETGLEEFWQGGYLSDEADDGGRRAYAMHWSDYEKYDKYRLYGTKARGLSKEWQKESYWSDKDVLGNIGKLDPAGDFTNQERKSYDLLSKRLMYATSQENRRRQRTRQRSTSQSRRRRDPAEYDKALARHLGILYPDWEDRKRMSRADYNKMKRDAKKNRKDITFGYKSPWKEQQKIQKQLRNWETKRNKRIEVAQIAKNKAEEEALILKQEIEIGKQRVQKVRIQREHNKVMARPDEGKIAAQGEAVTADNPQDYSSPKYTTRNRKRSSKVSNLGFFFNI